MKKTMTVTIELELEDHFEGDTEKILDQCIDDLSRDIKGVTEFVGDEYNLRSLEVTSIGREKQ